MWLRVTETAGEEGLYVLFAEAKNIYYTLQMFWQGDK